MDKIYYLVSIKESKDAPGRFNLCEFRILEKSSDLSKLRAFLNYGDLNKTILSGEDLKILKYCLKKSKKNLQEIEAHFKFEKYIVIGGESFIENAAIMVIAKAEGSLEKSEESFNLIGGIKFLTI